VVLLVEKIWPGSNATRERVEIVVVVVVLVLALVRVDHVGYYDHLSHFHHCCHHHHQPRERPIWDYPHVACVLQMNEGDCPCVECALL